MSEKIAAREALLESLINAARKLNAWTKVPGPVGPAYHRQVLEELAPILVEIVQAFRALDAMEPTPHD